jgi:hypothetical protein
LRRASQGSDGGRRARRQGRPAMATAGARATAGGARPRRERAVGCACMLPFDAAPLPRRLGALTNRRPLAGRARQRRDVVCASSRSARALGCFRMQWILPDGGSHSIEREGMEHWTGSARGEEDGEEQARRHSGLPAPPRVPRSLVSALASTPRPLLPARGDPTSSTSEASFWFSGVCYTI